MTQSKISQEESVGRLLAVALGWILLVAVASSVAGFLVGLVGSLLHAAPAQYLAISEYAGAFAQIGVLLVAAIIRGRIVGSGDINVGLGNKPVSRMPIIVSLAVITATYAVLLAFFLPGLGLVTVHTSPLWLLILNLVRSAIATPLAEESFFRGWLWTGLRKRWSVLSTAVLTSAFWIALHVGLSPVKPIVAIPVAIILAAARHFGQSVRAPIVLHATYNLVVITLPRLLIT